MRSQRGFTVIELLVVIGMVAVMSLIVLVQFGAGNDAFALGNAEKLIKTDLRGALTWAQGGRTCCSDQVPYGYGVYFDIGDSTYQVYAELDDDQMYTSGGLDEIIESVDLEEEGVADVTISSCTPDDGTGAYCDIYFSIPSGNMYSTGDEDSDTVVELMHSGTGGTETITIYAATGNVD